MRKTRIEMLLLGVTVVAMGAGVAAGLVAARLPSSATQVGPTIDRTPLVEELALTPDQRDQMRGVWEGVRDQARTTFEEAQALQKQRDEALVALLNDEQKAKFETISKEFASRYSALQLKRDKLFQDGVDRTSQLLNETQRKKYDEILRTRVGAGFGVPAPSAGTSLPLPK